MSQQWYEKETPPATGMLQHVCKTPPDRLAFLTTEA